MAPYTSVLQLALLFYMFSANLSFQPGLVLEMARILQENYCHPENLVGMQEAIQRAINSGEILQISDKKTLASVLTVGVQGALNDPRLIVSYEPNFIMAKTPSLRSVSAESLTRLMRKSVKMDVLENNTGYLRMDRITGEQSATGFSHVLRDIWDKAAHSSALILDLRYCTSGELSGVPFIISYFSDPELIHIDTVYNRTSNTTQEIWTVVSIGQRYGKNKDVIVLTSKHTNGAAEAVVYTLKHLKKAIIVGERTSGGSISVQTFRIASSDFYITVPVARSISPITGQSWEVSGVSPTIYVMAKEALRKAKTLLAERRAIPKVLQSVSNIITRFYAFTGRVSAILQQLQSTDLYSVVSEKDLIRTLNQNIQRVSEDTRLIIKNRNENADIEEPSEHSNFTEISESQGTVDFKVEVLPGNIGYLRFDIFISDVTKLDKSMSEKVWNPLKDTVILIIDLRYNTGGNSSSLSLILSYLHDISQKHHFFSIYNRMYNRTTVFDSLPYITGPSYGSKRGVYVLTSYSTAGAGEELAYLIQTLQHWGKLLLPEPYIVRLLLC